MMFFDAVHDTVVWAVEFDPAVNGADESPHSAAARDVPGIGRAQRGRSRDSLLEEPS
jgi:hypothetical protein